MWTYFAVTFLVTWSLWFASGVTSQTGSHGPWFLLGVFSPGLVALAFTARRAGSRGAVALLRRLVAWQVSARWFIFALGYMAVVKLTAAIIYRTVWSEWPRFGTEPWFVLLGATLMSTLVGGQAGEELGWRGYALPKLAERFGMGAGSILLGVVWALWHLPLFFAPAADTYHQSFPLYLLQVTALSIVMAWVYYRTCGSLVPVMLLHAAVNNTKDIVPSADLAGTNAWGLGHSAVGWLTVALLWVFAGFCLARMRPSEAQELDAVVAP
jgi:membrane protease YdiL (CAAX protease family)